MNYSIFDIESDGLIETATKIHCMSIHQVKDGVSKKFTLIKYADMIEFLREENILVGHNIIRFDIPMLEKFLKINLSSTRQIDTLGLSWYLYPERLKHGLEEWGDDFGVKKPVIEDWSNQNVEDYIYRCEQDVEINTRLFDMQTAYLLDIYGDADKANRLMGYLSFKLQCAREQEEVKWRVDVEKCEKGLEFLSSEMKTKIETLEAVMPLVTKYKIASRPKVLRKKDGSLSAHGQKWIDILASKGLPEYHVGDVKIPVKQVPGNPGSYIQLKEWLFSLGWVPENYKYVKEEDGTNRKIPQLNNEDSTGVCESIIKLYDKVPELEALDRLFVIRHRIGILEGFLEAKDSNNFVKAEISGFTNTLRFQHKKPIVNLPTIPKPYWEVVRGCLIAPDNDHVLCGSDMSGLEDNTKRHYMFYYDPEYVKEQMAPDFDSHLDIAVLANMITKDDMDFFKKFNKDTATPEEKKRYSTIKAIRGKSKKVNFAAVYLAGPPKIALTGGFPLSEAKILHGIYWKRNWSVKKIAQNCTVKTIGSQMWLLNPVSQLWYALRYDKDRFSTLNQSTGVYCFDTWIRNTRKQSIKICGQFHDEHIAPVLKGQEESHKAKLLQAIKWTNEELQLNVELRISIDFGHSYAEIH